MITLAAAIIFAVLVLAALVLFGLREIRKLVAALSAASGVPPARQDPGAPTSIVKGPHPRADWVSPNGKIKAVYRNIFTSKDSFSMNFLTVDGEPSVDGQYRLKAQTIGRWCLEQFVHELHLKQPDGSWTIVPFSWDVLDTLTGDLAGDWPSLLSLHILQNVVRRETDNADALKKTSLTPSGPSTVEAPPSQGPASG